MAGVEVVARSELIATFEEARQYYAVRLSDRGGRVHEVECNGKVVRIRFESAQHTFFQKTQTLTT
jgi:hypothetical protein